MQARSRYDLVAITLHWMIALGMLFQLAMGLAMVHWGFPIGTKFMLFQLHKSIGITILAAVILRVLWRLWQKPPALPRTMTRLEVKVAHGTHHLLYLLMLEIPLSGWLVASLSPLHIPTVLYKTIPWPALPVPAGWVSQLGEHRAGTLHAWSAYIILAAIALHLLAVIRHQFFKRDGVLARMLPLSRSAS